VSIFLIRPFGPNLLVIYCYIFGSLTQFNSVLDPIWNLPMWHVSTSV
jgi:hypothetical protein